MTASKGVLSDYVINSPSVVPYRFDGTSESVGSITPLGSTTPSKGDGRVMVIGIGGGRGAGKAYVCRRIIERVEARAQESIAGHVVHLRLDDFHRELAEEDRLAVVAGRAEINFDHPESFDFELLERVLADLRAGTPTQVPVWDPAQCRRTGVRDIGVVPRVVLLEGVLVLYARGVRAFLDMQVFVDVDCDTRLGRRVRDVVRAGGSLKRFLAAYLAMVKPAFEEFVLPTKRWADVIIPRGEVNNVAIDLIAQRVVELGAK